MSCFGGRITCFGISLLIVQVRDKEIIGNRSKSEEPARSKGPYARAAVQRPGNSRGQIRIHEGESHDWNHQPAVSVFRYFIGRVLQGLSLILDLFYLYKTVIKTSANHC